MLFSSPTDMGEAELAALSDALAVSGWKAKVIAVTGNPRAVIVKTDSETAPKMRDAKAGIRAGRAQLTPVLTSGAVGKLKRRAAGVAADGQVHE